MRNVLNLGNIGNLESKCFEFLNCEYVKKGSDFKNI